MSDRINTLLTRFPELSEASKDIELATEKIISCYKNGGKVLLCGNGGSAADCTHIVGELMKGFLKRRPTDQKALEILKSKGADDELIAKLQCALPAINLCESSALITAYCNDVDPEYIFAQQVYGLGKKGYVLIGLSTSGNAKNVNHAAKIAKALDMTVIGMTGKMGGKLSQNADICIKAPHTETYRIQEYHLPIYHFICALIEDAFFEN